MRLKSREILISIMISVSAIVLAIIFYCLSKGSEETGGQNLPDFLYSALIGVFGSAFVVLLIAVFDYSRAKSDALRTFCSAVYTSIATLYEMDYFSCSKEYGEKLVAAIKEYEEKPALRESLERKVKIDPSIMQTAQYKQFDDAHTYWFRALADQIKAERIKLGEEEAPEWLYLDDAHKEIESTIEKIRIMAAQYQTIANEPLTPLLHAFNDLGFFSDYFRRNKLKRSIQLEIVNPILGEHNKIITASRGFAVASDGTHYYATVLSTILSTQTRLFSIEKPVNSVKSTFSEFITQNGTHSQATRPTLDKVFNMLRAKWDPTVYNFKEKANGHQKAD